MSEKEKATPPPLLLMGASGNAGWKPQVGASLFMPLPQSGSSLMTSDDGGEEDSFVGQSSTSSMPVGYFQTTSSSVSQQEPFANVGHHPVPASTSATPKSQPPPTAAVPPTSHSHGTSLPPPSALPQFGVVPQVASIAPSIGGAMSLPPTLPSVTPMSSASTNKFRHQGQMKYAAPALGTYASPQSLPTENPPNIPAQPVSTFSPAPAPAFNPTTSFMPPPFSDGAKAPLQPPKARISDVGIPTNFVTPSDGFSQGGPKVVYTPVQHHWFYSVHEELRTMWRPFSFKDSSRLEQAVNAGHNVSTVVSVEGGRYNVTVATRRRQAVYWEEPASPVRRCSWFFRLDGDTRFQSYEEEFADRLEDAYRTTLQSGEWHKRLEFPGGDTIVIHNPTVIVHFTASSQPDEWGNTSSDQQRPRVVRRGIADINEDITAGEPTRIDHVIFVVHGIGTTCDLKFRNIVECVGDMRLYAQQMGEAHFGRYLEEGRAGRVEILPVRWHSALHGDATGVDRRLKAITLGSIGKLRGFTNDTLLDILFYSSPVYAQQIANTVGAEINRLHGLFLSRNPGFRGEFSLCGHSLGSLILFDLLLHQEDTSVQGTTTVTGESGSLNGAHDKPSTGQLTPVAEQGTAVTSGTEEGSRDESLTIDDVLTRLSLQDYAETFKSEQIDLETLMSMCEDQDLKEMGIPLGPRKKLQGFVKLHKHKQLKRKEDETEEKRRRELEQRLASEAAKQQTNTSTSGAPSFTPGPARYPLLRSASNTCVSYVQGAAGIGVTFVRYPRLGFEPAHFFALGSPIAMFLTVRGVDVLGEDFKFPTCPSFFNIFHPFDPVAYRLEPMIVSAYPPKPVLMPHHKGRKRLHLELRDSLTRMGADIKQRIIESVKATWATLNSFAQAHRTEGRGGSVEESVDSALQQIAEQEDAADTESLASSGQEDDILVGNINQGRRVDYVLQEKPIESFNDYLFALSSHLCYWESEDTMLMMLKEVYALHGLQPIKPGSQPPTDRQLAATSPPGPPPALIAPYKPGPYSAVPPHPRPAVPASFPSFNSPMSSTHVPNMLPSSYGGSHAGVRASQVSMRPPYAGMGSSQLTGNRSSPSPASLSDISAGSGMGINPYRSGGGGNTQQVVSGLVTPQAVTLGGSAATPPPPPLSGFVRKQ